MILGIVQTTQNYPSVEKTEDLTISLFMLRTALSPYMRKTKNTISQVEIFAYLDLMYRKVKKGLLFFFSLLYY